MKNSIAVARTVVQTQPSKGIFWLCSYPKSGNTWFRIFLGNVINLINEKKPIHLNDMPHLFNDHITTSRTWVNERCGYNTDHMNDDEIDALLPTLYTHYNDTQTHITYHKNHRAYTYLNDHQPLIPHCLGTIYIVRNPLDVSISLANHFNTSIDSAIHMLNDQSYALSYFPLRQRLLSWSMHVNSWLASKAPNLLVLRYEDMLMHPVKIFTRATDFLQLTVNKPLIEQAIFYSSFDQLKQFENNVGFADKPRTLKHFFRKGIAGDWQNELTQKQIQQIIAHHGETMQKFGYLNKYNQPIVG